MHQAFCQFFVFRDLGIQSCDYTFTDLGLFGSEMLPNSEPRRGSSKHIGRLIPKAPRRPDKVGLWSSITKACQEAGRLGVIRLRGHENDAKVELQGSQLLVDFVQAQGVLGSLHNCGYARRHLDVYPQLHHRGWGYLAPPPHGDVVLEEALEKLPPDMILWGNLDQIDFLRQASPNDVEERVRQVIETVKPRGNFILGTSDYLEVDTPYENLRAFADAGHKYGRYGN